MGSHTLTEKMNFSIPKDLAQKLRQYVPPGERSHVIAEVTNRYLTLLAQKHALKQVAGLWQNRKHLQTEANVRRCLRQLRGSTAKRQSRLFS